MNYSLNSLYKEVGISKQAVHKYQAFQMQYSKKLSELVLEVDLLRSEHPGCGVEKMYSTLRPEWIGRDNFIEVFMELGYKVRKMKNFIRTTIPAHFKYPNLIEGSLVWKENQLWQTDITYFQVGSRFYYIVFIIDVYTRRIVGYQVSDNLRAEANIKALEMAIKLRKYALKGLIHHSDRGSQYIDNDYTSILTKNGVHISMGEKAQDNAYAERINGTIKNEYLKYYNITSFEQLKRETARAVKHYNTKRRHNKLPDGMSPIQFEERLLNLNDQKRPTVIIYAEGNCKIREAFNLLNFRPEEEPLVHICPIQT
jgi:putative transposase